MPKNKKLWKILLAIAASLSYTLTFANNRTILKGNGEEKIFDELSEVSMYLYQKREDGTPRQLRRIQRHINSFNRSHKYDIYTGEAFEFGL